MSSLDFQESGAQFLDFPSRYYYVFTASNGTSVTVLRDEGVPTKTDGIGGWEVVERRRRKGLTKWTGRNPARMELPILFNGQDSDPPYSVDRDVTTLNQMAFGDNFVEPPTVKVDGYLPVYGLTWVIEDITWGDNQVWMQGDTGETIRVRQDAIVKLLQFVDEDVVKVGNLGQVPKPSTKPYQANGQETLKQIAKKVYGNSAMWVEIAKLNPGLVRGPQTVPAAGTILQMPPPLNR